MVTPIALVDPSHPWRAAVVFIIPLGSRSTGQMAHATYFCSSATRNPNMFVMPGNSCVIFVGVTTYAELMTHHAATESAVEGEHDEAVTSVATRGAAGIHQGRRRLQMGGPVANAGLRTRPTAIPREGDGGPRPALQGLLRVVSC